MTFVAQRCRNKRCGDLLPIGSVLGLCPCCRAAAGRGALLATVCGALFRGAWLIFEAWK